MPTKKTTENKSASARSRAPARSAANRSTTKSAAPKASAAKGEETKRKTAAKSAAAKSSTTRKAAPKKSASSRTSQAASGMEQVKNFDGKSSSQPLAIAFLMKQHREAEQMFQAYERAEQDEEKADLSRRICMALKVHTQIEEELLYPEAHDKLDDEDIVDEALVEHQGAKDLIAQIESMQVGEHLYDAKLKVLSEYIKHHVREEETEMFPELRKADMDLQAIGQRLEARAAELQEQMARGDEGGRQAGRGLLGGLFRGSDQRA